MALQAGNSGVNVIKLQNALNAKIKWSATDVKLVADGAFGAKTTAAVKLFQSQNALPATGIADNATAVKLGLFPSDVVPNTPLVQSPAKIILPSLTASSSTSFFEKNKQMIMIAGGVLGSIVVLSLVMNAVKSKAKEKISA